MYRLSKKVLVALSAGNLAIAMLLFRGGSYFERTPASFHLNKNVISDLGISETYAGTSQPIVTFFFALFISALITATIADFPKTSSRIQKLLLSIVSIAFFCVFLFPSNVNEGVIHNLAFFSGVITTGLLNLTYTNPLRRSFALYLLVYAIFLFFAPRPSSHPDWRLVHVHLQRITVVASLAALFFTKPNHD